MQAMREHEVQTGQKAELLEKEMEELRIKFLKDVEKLEGIIGSKNNEISNLMKELDLIKIEMKKYEELSSNQ